jgi:hypothetical protein
VPLAALRPLLAVAGAEFFSLQVGPHAKDIAETGLAERIIDLSHYFDFADSAAALSRLDLIVTVDTSIAHLAGPRYSLNSTVELRKLDQAMVLNRLLAESYVPSSRLGTDQFSLLANCVRTASCYELSFATLDDALPAIIGLAQ